MACLLSTMSCSLSFVLTDTLPSHLKRTEWWRGRGVALKGRCNTPQPPPQRTPGVVASYPCRVAAIARALSPGRSFAPSPATPPSPPPNLPSFDELPPLDQSRPPLTTFPTQCAHEPAPGHHPDDVSLCCISLASCLRRASRAVCITRALRRTLPAAGHRLLDP